MSRIGKQPIPVPDKVKVAVDGSVVKVEGPKGALEHRVPVGITVALSEDGKEVCVARVSDAKPHRELHGLTRTLIGNMVIGVTEGYKKDLELHGIGYSIKPVEKGLEFEIGLANKITLDLPDGIAVDVVEPTNPGRLVVTGCDKQAVGEFAARIRAVKPPEPYLGKGFRYVGEEVRRKAGKAFVGAGA